MPPTSFFSVNTIDDENADIDDLESILDDCISLSMPARYLGWHYRSKHESLITFSNENFYDNRLTTFPSANDRKSQVTWQYVEGFYDYGKTRTNRAEAEAIADEVIKRLQEQPQMSIGVVAFSKQQSDLIEDVISDKFVQYPQLDKLNRESLEPIFIKNLENVQGDERDVILFSVGYGPDKEGHVSMNFGPLNKVGGERRLNVAVSRARYEMKIFSTLRPEQIDERRTNAEGVLGLKRFLIYAGQENEKENEKIENIENQMIKQIASKLKEKGLEVRTSIGKSNLKVDIAVVDPLNPEKYILGIICDGSNYYNLKTMRDREIVQPSVLRMLGWNLMHIWSIDWLLHKEIILKQILEQTSEIYNACINISKRVQ
jgi:superfamily I DNA and/or RNA helicase